MEEREIKTSKESALRAAFGCSDSDPPSFFPSRAGRYFLPELKSGLQNKLHGTKHFRVRAERLRCPICGKTGNSLVGGQKFKAKNHV